MTHPQHSFQSWQQLSSRIHDSRLIYLSSELAFHLFPLYQLKRIKQSYMSIILNDAYYYYSNLKLQNQMGNKILGRRSKSFYRGFSERQVDYLKQKFETISANGKIDKQKFKQAYKLNDNIYDKFMLEADFNEDSNIDEYEFICMVHSLCSVTIEELGAIFFRILTKSKNDLNEKSLLNFTSICIDYNSYIEKLPDKKRVEEGDKVKINKKKFEKYDFDKNLSFDESEFIKICLKDEDYKKWMFNMGFITKRQLDFQSDVYDLVDSDIGDEVERHDKEIKANISNIKMGIEHRIGDEEFEVEESQGEQSVIESKPWVKATKNVQIRPQNPQPPNQSLEIEYVFGYRSFDCRNNVKYDNKGNIVYHQAAIGIVLNPSSNTQNFIVEHHDDITCLDVVENTVVTGQTGAKPQVIMWDSIKTGQSLVKKMVITQELKDGISCVALSESQSKLAVVCGDQNHRLVIYDVVKLQRKRKDPTYTESNIIALGQTNNNIPFDLKFDVSQKTLVLATIKQLLFISFEKGTLNSNRGTFGNFTQTPALCLQPLRCKYKSEEKQFMLSGMGNGSIYFWEKETCVKAVAGHTGSVSAICARKDQRSFISGDRSGTIIIWNELFQKQKSIAAPKTNCISNMIVALSCSSNRDLLVGTKSSDIYTLRIGDGFDRAKKVMSGHNEGQLNTLAVHRVQNYVYTGGEDQRLMKWEYKTKKVLEKQRKCPYAIRSIDLYNNEHLKQNLLVVGYKNGVVELFDPATLESLDTRFNQIKNPDEEVLNLVRINKDGTMCIACYLYPKFKIILLNLARRNMKEMKPLSVIELTSRVIAVDFDKESTHIRFNTGDYEYFVYNVDNFTKPVRVTSAEEKLKPTHEWATHTLPFSPETQGVLGDGVLESDIICCERTRKIHNVFVIGDKYSKIKLFNYPSKTNKIYNKYVGHSNEVTGLQFDRRNEHLISIGGQQKSIIVWKFNAEELKNQNWIKANVAPESDMQQKQISEQRKKKKLLLSQFDAEVTVGEQAMATKPFLGQIKYPSDYKEKYNARRDNKLPDEDASIRHVFGLRNRYLNDEVRDQVKFASDFKSILFPTACLGVRMSLQSRDQQFYHAHKEDIVSIAIDPSRKILATGQMAERNPLHPKQKIVAIYVWDIETKQVLKKLDGFLTVAIVLLSFSPNGKLLYACGNDDKNMYAIYDWISGSILYSGPTSRAKVNGIAWKNNEQFMTCGMDHVKFWEGMKSQMGKINGKNQSMLCCASSGKVYITGSISGGLYVWLSNQSNKKIEAHSGKVHALAVVKGFLYSGGADGNIKAWKTQANGQIKMKPEIFFDTRSAYQSMLQTVKNIPQEQFGVLSLDFSDKNQVIIGTFGSSVIYFNGKKSQVIHAGHYRGELWALTTQIRKNNDNLIVTGGDDRSLRVWDIDIKRQVTRYYMQNKVRGIDWSNDGQKIVVGDSKAKVFMFNRDLSSLLCEYTGKPYRENAKNLKMTKQQQQQSREASSMERDPFIQQLKFSPNCKMVAYGSHGISMYMQILNVEGKELKLRKDFSQGSSAVLHIDWSRDSDKISVNNQAYQYRFFNSNGTDVSASSCADERWATMTRKFGFQVKGIFQGVDYSDVNTVCRDPTEQFLAVGYDDQSIRLFKYPCYIEKQVHKTLYGHSSHVTRIKFTSSYMVSLGGLDRTIIVWNIIRPQLQNESTHYTDEDDGLDDLDEGVDLPGKAVMRKQKAKKVEEFYQVEDEGDEFMAVKPWLGAIKQPTYQYPKQTNQAPKGVQIKLEYVHGYRVKDCRQNLYYVDKQTILFHAAAVVIFHNIPKNTQTLLTPHNDDILSIDYHKASGQVVTGELGPKPVVCLFKNGKLTYTYAAPVKKGVLALAISPDGRRAACAGMDEDHTVAILDLDNGKILAVSKGTRKVITKIVWTGQSSFVTVGISHFKTWTFQKGLVPGKESSKRYNNVSVVYDDQTKRVFTGASKGTIVTWSGSEPQKGDIELKIKNQEGEEDFASVVDCLLIEKNLLLAGTKDGMLYVIDKKSKQQLSMINLAEEFEASCCPGIRALNILGNKLLVGTLGSQIYEFEITDLAGKKSPVRNCETILKCHYSPNNTWTNEVWGLHVYKNFLFTCSDDATVRCWSITDRKLLSCASTNVSLNKDNVKQQLEMDKKTKDFTDAAKSRAVSVSPDGRYVAVGSKNGIVRIYSFNPTNYRMELLDVFRHAKEWISDIKFGFNMLIVGSHDNGIYVYDFEEGKAKRKYAPLRKHSSYITHLDVSRDSCFLQSTCGAYELLFWDLNSGKQLTSGATLLRDELWSTWTCNLGWPVQGIYPKCEDGTFINAVDRSNFSVNNTRMKDDSKSPFLLAAGNDHGKVCVYNYPCTIKSSKYIEGRGHSSHVTTVRWKEDDTYLFSVGGEDQCLMYWKVSKK